MSGKNKVNIRDKNFRREVGLAKTKYRKKRFTIFIAISFVILVLLSIRIYFFVVEKNNLNMQLEQQKKEIAELDKENKVNEILISKFKDPYFITDLARQEYSMSYPGEIIFNLPLRESFIDNYIKSVKDGEIKLDPENESVINEEKLNELLKKKADKDKKADAEAEKKDKKLNESNNNDKNDNKEDNKETGKEEVNKKDKKDQGN